jgi:hypothetical protein
VNRLLDLCDADEPERASLGVPAGGESAAGRERGEYNPRDD